MDAVAGIKIMILKRCAKTAPVNAPNIATPSMFLRPPLPGLSARPHGHTKRHCSAASQAKFPPRSLILGEADVLLFYLLQCNFPQKPLILDFKRYLFCAFGRNSG